jgi:pSer/pThr/pTyr-binding forkhead associated (FHA) protein
MKGAQAGREISVPVSEFLIGRGEECHLRPRSDAISRQHCAIIVGEKEVVMRDLGSKNGSYVNGERVEGERVVRAGDQIQFGPLQFELVTEHALGGPKKPAAKDVKEVAARTAAPSNDDLDIAQWLEDEDDTDTSRAVATPETRQFQFEDTSNLALETNVQGKNEPEDAQAKADAQEGTETDKGKESKQKSSERWKKSGPGKLPRRPSSVSKDSREAAADMLKRFFNRG